MATDATLAPAAQLAIRSHAGVRYDAYRAAIGQPNHLITGADQVVVLTDQQEADMIAAVGHRHGPIETVLADNPTPEIP